MLKKLQKSKSEGFTIIEVMIVLAIAGLIILIVLLAVPALQRNGRNTAIKNDASAIAAGIGEFASNNDGAIPLAANSTCGTGSVSLNNASGTASSPKVQGSTIVKCQSNATVTAADYDPGKIVVDFGYKCNNTNSAAVTASARATAIIYSIETSSTSQPRCLDS